VTKEPSAIEVLTDPRYKDTTLFCMLSAISGQLTASAAVPICLSSVMSEIPEVNFQVAVYMINGFQVIGAIIGPLLINCLSIKTIMVLGWAIMALSLCLVVIFQLSGVPFGILLAFVLLGIAWQISGGSFFFVYVS
jgi:hypothetical protein